jgi:hypothetical protein
MQKLFLIRLVVPVLGLSSFAQNIEPVPAPAEVTLNIGTEGDQHQFHLGELIPFNFSYNATIPGRYIWVSRNEKLTGGHGLEVTCTPAAESAGRPPSMGVAAKRFEEMLNSCGGFGGGVGGGCGDCDYEHILTTTPLSFGGGRLNTFVRFRVPGRYTCVAASADITTASADEKIRSALLVKSNPIDLAIIDDPGWGHSAAISYAHAYDQLCRVEDVQKIPFLCFDIAARITYLDTPESLSTEVRFFDGRTRWGNGFWEAIQSTSYPVDSVRLMTNRIQDPDFEVSTTTLAWLASSDLRIEWPAAFEVGSPGTYHSEAVEKMRKLVRLVGSSLSGKNSDVLRESAKTYALLAGQEYCDGRPLIPKQERNQVLADTRMRP